MAYSANKEPDELTALTSLDAGDVFVVGDVSDASEVAKYITKTNLITDLSTSFAPALGADDNYVTDAEKTKLSNLSGTNTGDQTITNSSDATSHTVTLSASGGSIQLIEGTNVTLTTGGTASAGTLTIAASGASGATTALDNLASVAINTSLISDTDNTDDLGTTLKKWANLFVTNIGATATRVTKGWFTDIESTNMPTVGGTAILTSLTAPQFTTIELGHASDTTLSRVSAGVVAVEGTNLVKAGAATSSGLTMATSRVLGRTTAATGAIEELSTVDSFVTAASDTAAGKVELATAAETNTGTDATRAVTPDGLAGSNLGIRYVAVTLNGTTALTTSEKAYFRIPAALTGMNLVSVAATVGTGAAGSSSSGTPTFTVKNVTDNNQMLSTSLTVDANEYTSATAATAAVINASFDDVVTDDLIEVACTVAGTGVTYATVTLGFQLP